MARRDFGTVRRRSNGRWQARYWTLDGQRRSRSFPTRADAARFLAHLRADIDRGTWADPARGTTRLSEYAATWLELRRVRGQPLAPRTRERYDSCLRIHILPTLGSLRLRDIDTAAVRGWHAQQLASGLAHATLAKNYRLLHTVLASAVTEEQIARNPCAIPGASAESSAERPVINVQDVFAIADTIAPRYRALVLLATFCGLRFGELAGLTRADLDLATGRIRVERDLDELDNGRLQPGRVKSNASRRTVTIPTILVDDVRQHLSRYAEAGPAGALFIGAQGGRLRRSNFRTQHWIPTVTALGLEHMRFHDLRHTGNTLAAATGASTRELMRRLGHASTRAAMIYQHATLERDTAIAEQLSALITQARGVPDRE